MTLELSSNNINIPFNDRYFAEMIDSCDLLDDPCALRARFLRDGYLKISQALDSEQVWSLRENYMDLFDPQMFMDSTSPRDGLFSGKAPLLPAHGTPGHPAHAFVRTQMFKDFACQPRLQQIAEILLETRARPLQRQILRHFVKNSRVASRAHVDLSYLDQGTERLVTFWVPIGDCPLTTGGLVYLEGSHNIATTALQAKVSGVIDRSWDSRPITHDLRLLAECSSRRWLWCDFRAGDIAIHSPRIIHASLDCHTDMMKVSADIRFAARDSVADPRWAAVWSGDDGF